MGEHCFKRSPAPGRHGRKEGELEPAPVLITSFQVEIGWPPKGIPEGADRLMAHARLEPDIKDIFFLGELSPMAVRAFKIGRKQILCLPLEPGIGSLALKNLLHRADGFSGKKSLVAGITIKCRDRGGAPAAPAMGI